MKNIKVFFRCLPRSFGTVHPAKSKRAVPFWRTSVFNQRALQTTCVFLWASVNSYSSLRLQTAGHHHKHTRIGERVRGRCPLYRAQDFLLGWAEDHTVLGSPVDRTGLHQAKAATLEEIGEVLHEPKVVRGPPEGQCLFHMSALL